MEAANGFQWNPGRLISPDLIQQSQAFLGHRVSGHHFAVIALNPFENILFLFDLRIGAQRERISRPVFTFV
jgi:hypothetical protein